MCVCVSPENGQVWRLHQHLHQRVHHLCVEDDGVHHLPQLLVVGDTQTGFRDACVGLKTRTWRTEWRRHKATDGAFGYKWCLKISGGSSASVCVGVLWKTPTVRTVFLSSWRLCCTGGNHTDLYECVSKGSQLTHTCSLNQSSLMPLKSNTSPSSTVTQEHNDSHTTWTEDHSRVHESWQYKLMFYPVWRWERSSCWRMKTWL